jgi:hypothetical protein
MYDTIFFGASIFYAGTSENNLMMYRGITFRMSLFFCLLRLVSGFNWQSVSDNFHY